MAGGWSKDGAVQDQIDDSVREAVDRARRNLPANTVSLTHCDECAQAIPEARQKALPGVQFCVQCQTQLDKQQQQSHMNRRGSKDSQLR